MTDAFPASPAARSRAPAWLALVLLPCLAAARGSGEPLWAVLKDAAEIKGLVVRLGDLADVGGVDPEAVAHARNLDLGPAPGPGQTRLLTAETVRTLLEKANAGGPAITVRGAATVRLQPQVVALSSDEVATLARRWLARSLGTGGAAARFEPSTPPVGLVAPAGRWSTRFEVVPPKDPDPAGLVHLVVQAVVDGTPSVSCTVDLVVRRQKKVLVARTDLLPDRPLDPAQVGTETRDLDGSTSGILADLAEVRGLTPRARIPAGQALTARDFRRPAAVLRNDPVLVQIRSGNLTVRGEGLALQDGSPGDRIPVRTMPGRQLVQAVIIDSRTVEVTLDTPKGTK